MKLFMIFFNICDDLMEEKLLYDQGLDYVFYDIGSIYDFFFPNVCGDYCKENFFVLVVGNYGACLE